MHEMKRFCFSKLGKLFEVVTVFMEKSKVKEKPRNFVKLWHFTGKM
jgi:hypothetical protein